MKQLSLDIRKFILVYLMLSKSCALGKHAWCLENSDGFSLKKDYNRNSPPADPFHINIDHVLMTLDKVDDMTQQIKISIMRTYSWEDLRITPDFKHPYWNSITNETRKYISVDGTYAEECFWMPKLHLFDARKMQIYEPTPTNLEHIPLHVSLTKNKTIVVTSVNLQLTLNCIMDFRHYPFDKQTCVVNDVLASSHFEQNHSWSINGNFHFLEKDLIDRGRELQYQIEPMPHITAPTNITAFNVTMPNFAWKLSLKRILVPYMFETFIPMTIMVIVSWISFIIQPENVPGRGGLLVTLLLVLTTFHLQEMQRCPAVREPTPLVIWTSINLFMVALALFEYAFILYYIRFEKKKSKIEGKITNILKGNNEDEMTEMTPIITRVKRKVSIQLSLAEVPEVPELPEAATEQKSLSRKNSEKVDPKNAVLFDKTSAMIDYYALRISPITFTLFLFAYFIYVTCTE